MTTTVSSDHYRRSY